MDIIWIDDKTYLAENRFQDGRLIRPSARTSVTWHQIKDTHLSFMARCRSAMVVITKTDGPYWVSLVFESDVRLLNINRNVDDVDSLDEALIEASVWSLEMMADVEALS